MGREKLVRHVHLFLFAGDQAKVSAREFMCLSECVCALQSVWQPHFPHSVK